MKKTTVLQIISELGDGGVEAMLMDAYRNIDHRKIRFVFVVQSNRRRYEDEITHLGGAVHQVSPLKEVGLVAYMRSIISICKKEKADVVHCHNLTQNPILLLAAKLAGVQYRISHSHLTTTFSRKIELMMPIFRTLIAWLSTDLLACGKEAGRFLYGKRMFLTIKNAIDIDKFLDAPQHNIHEELNLNPDTKVLLHVGRLSQQKNHDFLVQVMKKISSIRKDVVLLCCGSGPDEERVTNQIKEQKLEAFMLLLGSRSDIPQLMKAANLLVLPSLYEGFPVTLVESQASGIPAIASDRIDSESDLGLGLVEFLPVDSVDEWVNSILSYLDNPKAKVNDNWLRETLIEQGYSSKQNSRILEKMYLKSCNFRREV